MKLIWPKAHAEAGAGLEADEFALARRDLELPEVGVRKAQAARARLH
jgi:hypothetical protein